MTSEKPPPRWKGRPIVAPYQRWRSIGTIAAVMLLAPLFGLRWIFSNDKFFWGSGCVLLTICDIAMIVIILRQKYGRTPLQTR